MSPRYYDNSKPAAALKSANCHGIDAQPSQTAAAAAARDPWKYTCPAASFRLAREPPEWALKDATVLETCSRCSEARATCREP
jgi:hypothetical protein